MKLKNLVSLTDDRNKIRVLYQSNTRFIRLQFYVGIIKDVPDKFLDRKVAFWDIEPSKNNTSIIIVYLAEK